MLAEWLAALEGTAVATGLRNSLLVGGSAPLSLRILGTWKSIPLEPLRRALVRTADAGFLLALAGTLGMRRLSARASAGGRPGAARVAAAFSLAAWLAVLTLGRLIGYF